MNKHRTEKPYGLWESPISARLLSQGVRLSEVRWSLDGKMLVWLEGRSGFGMLMATRPGEPGKALNSEISCAGGVGYGGGEFSVTTDTVYFCGQDGKLYARPLDSGFEQEITPAYGGVASPSVSPDGKWVVFVFSDGKSDALAIVDADGSQWPQKLAAGADFYMQPVWHPAGTHLAWVEWNHPDMPWDHSTLKIAEVVYESCPVLTQMKEVAGMEGEIVFQPQFSPDGRYLSFITSRGNWDALVFIDLTDGKRHDLYVPAAAHLMEPAWVQGMRSYGWQPDSKRINFLEYQNGTSTLREINIDSGQVLTLDSEGYSWLKQIDISSTGQIALIGTSASIPARVLVNADHTWQVVARSSTENVPEEYLSQPRSVSWNAEDGSQVFGLYYAPVNPHFHSPGLPPAILHIHGGPTSQAVATYSNQVNYFTSRGYAYLQVNHRGSTGYGYEYRRQLEGNWGRVDAEDAAGGAQALVAQGLANPNQLIIMGGSAGGYTVLNSLIQFPGVFKAGVCLYGVSNLFLLDQDTHKFEAFYNSSLIGTLPEAAKKYHAWSPVFHADKIRDAVAIFQGEDDKVVPPNQSEEIVASLQKNGVPYIYKTYSGEGHGFRKSETLLDFYPRVERFLQQYVLFAPE